MAESAHRVHVVRVCVVLFAAMALVLGPVAPAHADYVVSSENYFFAYGTGADSRCASGSGWIHSSGYDITSLSRTYAHQSAYCLYDWEVSGSSLQAKANIYEAGYPPVLCTPGSWSQGGSQGAIVWWDTTVSPLYGCGPGTYFTNAEHYFYFPWAWRYGAENSGGHSCVCSD